MCLYDKKRFRIALKPIKVWKVCLSCNGELRTPFQYSKVHRIMFGGLNFAIDNLLYNTYAFKNGFIHAFQTKTEAENFAKRMHMYTKHAAVLIEAYIPRFVRYAIGTDGDICSRILILNYEKAVVI